jgi:TM2 domain-containing membrane protein YozV
MLSKVAIFFNQPKKRGWAVILALVSCVTPLGGLHKFYLSQPLWGIIYFYLSWQSSTVVMVASAIDAVWYLAQELDNFNLYFNALEVEAITQSTLDPTQVDAISSALRELDKLREDGLISEHEFEQKRRQLL